MEMMACIQSMALKVSRVVLIWALTMVSFWSPAQPVQNTCTIKDGKLFITLNRNTVKADLWDFVAKYNLDDLKLEGLLINQALEPLRKLGWSIDEGHKEWFIISKPIEDLGNLNKPEIKSRITDMHAPDAELYPLGVVRNYFGYNRLKSNSALVIEGNTVTIFLDGYKNARQVKLAGSFTRWQFEALPMKQSSEGWYLSVKLEPGKHYYKFMVDDGWTTHKANMLDENDGRGNVNSVLYMPNHTFKLPGFQKNKNVYLSGSFINWQPRAIAMRKQNDGWQLQAYVPEGTHTYRYVVDHQWMEDPVNQDRFPNEFGEYNSVVRMGKPMVFRLNGFDAAKKVTLAGTFNNWVNEELFLKKVNGGWEMNYTPGAGNHAYHYWVDGKMVGPSEPVNGHWSDVYNLIQSPNYTFRLKGFTNAKIVYISGNFNQWSTKDFPMRKTSTGWEIDIHLKGGKTSYKFIVDGEWIIDPENKYWEDNEHHTRNSVLWLTDYEF